MDFYDIFKTLSKGIKFKDRVIGVRQKPQPKIKAVVKEESDVSDTDSKTDGIEEDVIDIKSENESDNEIEEVVEESDRNGDAGTMQLMAGLPITEDGITSKRKRKKKGKIVTEERQKQMEHEEDNRFRNEHSIRISGRRVPAALHNFESLETLHNLSPKLSKNLNKCNYKEPTPIQRQALSCLMQGRDVLASAPTGSGKTVAFLLPVLNSLVGEESGGDPRALILCPTRELAQQIHTEALRLSEGTNLICTLLSKSVLKRMNEKKSELQITDLLISTPSRLCYLLEMENSPVKFNRIEWLIVDEADRLVEGSAEHTADFHSQLNTALSSCILENSSGIRRHMAFFSATHTPILARLARRHTHKLITITVGHRNTATTAVEQKLTYCGSESGKLLEFRQLIKKGIQPPVLVFVQSKDRAKQLFKELLYDGINVDVIHADRTQQQRDNVVRSFRCGGVWVLVCTELMARGLDFRGVNLVINYDMPPSAISYIHRVGRAGRAGRSGEAITFFTDDDVPNLRSIAVVMKESGCDVPEFLLGLKKASSEQKKKLLFKPPNRDDISTARSQKRKSVPENPTDGKKQKLNAKESPQKKRTQHKNKPGNNNTNTKMNKINAKFNKQNNKQSRMKPKQPKK